MATEAQAALQTDFVRLRDTPHKDMVWIPGGTFRMGSDRHYPEEAPVHRVTVDGFWIDRTPVTNRQFRAFVEATGHVTFAEIAPDPKDYPGALPHMLNAGSLVFTPPSGPVDLRDCSQWWTFMKRRQLAPPLRPGSTINGLDDHPVVHVAFDDAEAYAVGRQGTADRGRMGVRRARRPGRRRIRLGRRVHCPAAGRWPTPGRANSRSAEPRDATATSAPRRSAPSRRTATASTT